MESDLIVVGRVVSVEENKHLVRDYVSGGRFDDEKRAYQQSWVHEAILVVDEILQGRVELWVPNDSTRAIRLLFAGHNEGSDGRSWITSADHNFRVGDQGIWCLEERVLGRYRSQRYFPISTDQRAFVQRCIDAIDTNYAGWPPGITRDRTSWDMQFSSDVITRVIASVFEGRDVWIHGSYSGELRIDGERKLMSLQDQFIALADASGELRWIRSLGFHTGATVKITAEENGVLYSAGGHTLSDAEPVSMLGVTMPYSGPRTHLLARISSEGEVRWAQSFGGTIEYLTPFACKDGSCWVVGSFRDEASCAGDTVRARGGYDPLVGKLDHRGELIFLKSIGGPGHEGGVMSALGPSDELVIATSVREESAETRLELIPADIVLARIATDGRVAWSDTLGGSLNETSVDVAVGSDGRIALAVGVSKTGNRRLRDYSLKLMMFNPNGDLLWEVPGGGHDIEIDNKGNIFCLGTYDENPPEGLPPSAGDTDIFLMCFDRKGKRLWSLRDGGVSADDAGSLHLLPDGRALIVGEFNGTSFVGGQVLESGGWEDSYIVNVPMKAGRRK